jgi:hypothetical protein
MRYGSFAGSQEYDFRKCSFFFLLEERVSQDSQVNEYQIHWLGPSGSVYAFGPQMFDNSTISDALSFFGTFPVYEVVNVQSS